MVAAADPDDRGRVALRRGQLISSQVEARQNRRTDSAGVTEGDPVRPYRLARKNKVPRYLARIENAAHQVQSNLRAKMIVVHVGRLTPYLWGCSGRVALRREQCDRFGVSLGTRRQLSLNNVNKQMLRDNNPNRRCNNTNIRAPITMKQCNRDVAIEGRQSIASRGLKLEDIGRVHELY
jgi:hypothetical protein